MPDAARVEAENIVQRVLDEAGPTLQKLASSLVDHPQRASVGFLVLDLRQPESRALAVKDIGAGAADFLEVNYDRAGLHQACCIEYIEWLHAFYLEQGGTEAAWTRGIDNAPARGLYALPGARPAIVATGKLVAIAWIMFSTMSRGGSA